MYIMNDQSKLPEALGFLEENIRQYDKDKKSAARTMLLAEEALVSLMAHTPKDAQIKLTFAKRFGSVTLSLAAQGEAFDMEENNALVGGFDLEGVDEDAENAIRSLILRSQSEVLRYKHKRNRNTIQITVKRSDRTQLYLTLGALALSVILGTVLKIAAPEPVQTALDEYVLSPVKNMFLSALKMIIGPVVFFSIVSCLSQFDNLKELGKIGAKVMGMYLFTTVLAVAVGMSIYFLIQPGDSSLAAFITDAAEGTIQTATGTNISLFDTFVNIVPANFIRPFIEGDMLQIIFLAVLCGTAAGMIGDYSKTLKDFFESCNLLFLKITTIIVKVIPLAVLCSMTSLVMLTGTEMLLSIMSFVGTFLLALLAMVGVYCLLVLFIGKLNPLILLKKHAPAMVTNFSLASSNAAMPFNIASCNNMGVSSKVSSFAIPLGATVNMDGSCIYMAVAGLFLAHVFGVELSGAALFSMILSIIVLSVGAPGIPGSGLVCLSVLLVQIGVPAEALSLIMGIDSLLGMFRVVVNSTGDVAVSLIVGKTENLVDVEKYKA